MKRRLFSAQSVETPQSSAALWDEEALEKTTVHISESLSVEQTTVKSVPAPSVPNTKNKINENFIFMVLLTDTKHFSAFFALFRESEAPPCYTEKRKNIICREEADISPTNSYKLQIKSLELA